MLRSVLSYYPKSDRDNFATVLAAQRATGSKIAVAAANAKTSRLQLLTDQTLHRQMMSNNSLLYEFSDQEEPLFHDGASGWREEPLQGKGTLAEERRLHSMCTNNYSWAHTGKKKYSNEENRPVTSREEPRHRDILAASWLTKQRKEEKAALEKASTRRSGAPSSRKLPW